MINLFRYQALRWACLSAIFLQYRSSFAEETASLRCELVAGSLSIDPTSIAGNIRPVSGFVVSADYLQSDAVVFRLEGVRVTDFNGDGRGFKLVAFPESLWNQGPEDPERRELTLGTLTGFTNPSIPQFSVIRNRGRGETRYSQLRYRNGDGCDLEVDLEFSYDVPAFAAVGEYAGVVRLSVTAD